MARHSEVSVVEILSAITTNERVAEALGAYPDRDHAVEVLEDDVLIARRLLVQDLRSRLLPHTASAARPPAPPRSTADV